MEYVNEVKLTHQKGFYVYLGNFVNHIQPSCCIFVFCKYCCAEWVPGNKKDIAAFSNVLHIYIYIYIYIYRERERERYIRSFDLKRNDIFF